MGNQCCSGPEATTTTAAVRETEGLQYKNIASAIKRFPTGPAGEGAEIILKLVRDATVEELKHPSGRPELSLLVLANGNEQWTTLLLKKCDPSVHWKENGRVINLGHKFLANHHMHSLWSNAVNDWRRAQTESTNNGITPTTQSVPAVNESWWMPFVEPAQAIGFAATTAAASSIPGFMFGQLICSGIWTAIKAWRNRYSEIKQLSDQSIQQEIEDTFASAEDVVKSTLKLLDEQMQGAVGTSNDTFRSALEIRAKGLTNLLNLQIEGMSKLLRPGTRIGASSVSRKESIAKMYIQLFQWHGVEMAAIKAEAILREAQNISRRVEDFPSYHRGLDSRSTLGGDTSMDGMDETQEV